MLLRNRIIAFLAVGLCLCCCVYSGGSDAHASSTPSTVGCSGASPTWTSTPAALSTCISGASSGDTINVSSGSVNWSSPVTITNKTLTINGGAGGGTTTLNATGTGSNPYQPGLFMVSLGDDYSFIIGGFTLTSTKASLAGLIQITGTQQDKAKFRIHHMTITDTPGIQLMIFRVYGVIDSSTFTRWTSAQVFIDASGDVQSGGDWSVAKPVGLGTVNAVYVEGNTFIQSGDDPGNMGAGEHWDGARAVWRYNTFQNSSIYTHGYGDTDSTHPYNDRGPVKMEIYNNSANCNPPSGHYCMKFLTIRGGTGVIFNNYITDTRGDSWESGTLVNPYYALMDTATDKDHTRCTQDENGGACVHNACATTTSHSYRSRCLAYPCTDQFGYVGKTQLPYYIWNNSGDNVTHGITVNSYWGPSDGYNCTTTPRVFNSSGQCSSGTNVGQCFIRQNRDYYITTDSSGAKAGYTPYTCPHPFTGLTGSCDSSTAGTAGYRRGRPIHPNNF